MLCVCVCVCLLASLHLVEVSRVLVFTGDHVKEDGNGRPSQLLLWDQSHLQDGTHHAGDETDLVAAWKTILHYLRKKKKVKSCLTSSPYAWWIHAVLSALQLWGFCTAVCVVINVIPSTDIYFLSPLLLHSVCPSRLGGLGELGRVAGVSLSHNHLHWHCTADSELPDRLMCLFLDCGEEVGLTEVKPCRCRENKPNSRQEGPKSLMWFVLEWTAARLSCTVA